MEPEKKSKKGKIAPLIIGIVGMVGGAVMAAVPFLMPKEELAALNFPQIPSAKPAAATYSKLTGLPPADASKVDAPTYCIQTPNGTDGARPQAGLTQAGVVFDAIAEAGITRFAAIYQAPTSAVIGPIRSLRLYFLQWDTPFDCTIVRAGGADDAIEAVQAGGYKDLTENYNYMYRGSYGNRLWNNLFTTATDLSNFTVDYGYGGSNVTGFSRMTPEESNRNMIDATVSEKLVITAPASGNTSSRAAKVTHVDVDFASSANYNVTYDYNAETNTYTRGYESGYTHEVYVCPDEDMGEQNPEDICSLAPLTPSVVVTMMVEEHRAEDNYHENITTIGSGDAVVFQNGIAIEGRWEKNSVGEQLKFYDKNGSEIRLAPGQTFVEAVPNYGGVYY